MKSIHLFFCIAFIVLLLSLEVGIRTCGAQGHTFEVRGEDLADGELGYNWRLEMDDVLNVLNEDSWDYWVNNGDTPVLSGGESGTFSATSNLKWIKANDVRRTGSVPAELVWKIDFSLTSRTIQSASLCMDRVGDGSEGTAGIFVSADGVDWTTLSLTTGPAGSSSAHNLYLGDLDASAVVGGERVFFIRGTLDGSKNPWHQRFFNSGLFEVDVVLNILPWAHFIEEPESRIGFEGYDAHFQALAQGKSEVSYQWEYSLDNSADSFTSVTGATSTTLWMEPLTLADDGFYRCVATNSYGTSTSLAARLTMYGAPVGDGQIVLNEFQAINKLDLYDEYGLSSDWIELYNADSEALNLEGWYLTDDALDLTKWRFPVALVEPGGYQIVFASGFNRAVYGQDLHTNFSLNGGGEYLALVKPDGTTIVGEFAPAYPAQLQNVSFGLSSEAAGVWRYQGVPSPGGANGAGSLGLVADTTFSVDRGFFDAPFDVEINCGDPLADIRYTTDTSWPSVTSGTLYTGPISIKGTTNLRAMAYREGYLSSNVDTQTYIFLSQVLHQKEPADYPLKWSENANADYWMDPEIVDNAPWKATIIDDLKALPSLSIVLERDDLLSTTTGIYMNPRKRGVEWERRASAEFLYPESCEAASAYGRGPGDSFQVNCGVRIQGNITRKPTVTPKHPLRLLFKAKYGPTLLHYPLYGPDGAGEYNTLVCRAGYGNAWYHTSKDQRNRALYIRDEVSRVAQLEVTGYSSHGIFVHMYLNGLYWGLYNVVERPDGAWASSYFGGEQEDYDAVNSAVPTDGDLVAWKELLAIADQGLASDAVYAQLQEYVDIENYIDYMIMCIYQYNNDWPAHNWYGVRRREPGGQYKFISWDAERTLEGISLNRNLSKEGLPLGEGSKDKNSPAYLYSRLQQNANFRLQFADRVHELFFNDGLLTAEKNIARLQGVADQLRSAINGESARWGDWRRDRATNSNASAALYTKNPYWDMELARLVYNYLPARPAVVVQQWRDIGLYPQIAAPVFSLHGGKVVEGYPLTMSAAAGIYYTVDGSDPRGADGSVAAGATLYSSALSVERTVRVAARSYSGGSWSALNHALFVAGVPSLTLTELNFNPPPPEDFLSPYTGNDFEFVELKNTGTFNQSLLGMRFTKGFEFNFDLGAVTSLKPGEFVLVVRNLTAFRSRYGTSFDAQIAGEFQLGGLSSSGELVRIKDSMGRTVLEFEYLSARGWPVAADGAGHSLVPIQSAMATQVSGSLDYGRNWRASAYIHGSPGADDPELAPTVLLNEIVAHTDYNDPSRPEYDSNDWVEVYNASSGSVDLTGWYLSDDMVNLKKWAIPSESLAAGAYRVFDEVSGFHNPITSGFGLSKDGERVYLSYLPGNAQDRVVDAVRFKGQENDFSLGRYPDAKGLWQTLSRTPTAPNMPPFPHVRINEIMYNPAVPGSSMEYIEIYNPGPAQVDLWNVDGPWRIDGGVSLTFPDATSIARDGYLLVVNFDPAPGTTRTLFESTYGLTPGSVDMVGPYLGSLSDKGERVALERAQTPDILGGTVSWVIADEAIYFEASPWPVGPDGWGFALHRTKASASANNPAAWSDGKANPGGPRPLVPEAGVKSWVLY